MRLHAGFAITWPSEQSLQSLVTPLVVHKILQEQDTTEAAGQQSHRFCIFLLLLWGQGTCEAEVRPQMLWVHQE